MDLSLEQKRFIKSRCNGYKLLKGKYGSGKTTAVINRIPVLIKSYAPEKEDTVLVAAYNDEHLNKLSIIYENIGKDKYRQSSFFDEENFHKLKINTIDSLTLYYFEKYKEHHDFSASLAKEEEVLKCVKSAISVVKDNIKRKSKISHKILNINNLEFIRHEIGFIKESNISSLDEYQSVVRIKNDYEKSLNISLRKNCKARDIIYNIYKEYNDNLKSSNLIDRDDMNLFALNEALNDTNERYTHIIIDETQEFTKVQLDLLKALYNEKNNSSMIFTIDTDKLENSRGWINKKRNFKTLGYNMVGKCNNFKCDYLYKDEPDNLGMQNIEEHTAENITENPVKEIYNETSTYIDLSRKVLHEFFIDNDVMDEVYTSDDNFTQKEENIVEVPVFNEIAAGSPILMNESIESRCYLPKQWIRASRDVFILKIKGDSMVNRNINDGDHVVINKQKYPQSKDIVAVEIEGEATLKTFNKKGREVVLTPENDAYDPIILDGDKEFSILGVAIGLIKGMI
ncbi:MAG: transcriptional repressor LexA [Clostridium sp.]|nr:transcriptional repressor LexA [Clostridium sp.]